MFLIADFEASSLHHGSYPIEVAWVDEHGQGEAHLIRPAEGWEDWSVASQTIHGISRERLAADGEDAAAVAHRVADVFGDANAVYCDGGWFDQGWLNVLTGAAGIRRIVKLSRIEDLWAAECQPLLALLPAPDHRLHAEAKRRLAMDVLQLVEDVAEAERARIRIRHRALDDAQGLLWRWRELRARVAALVG